MSFAGIAVIQIPATAEIFVMHEPISFHNGIDGTAAIVRQVLAHEPMDGAFFVFRNRRRLLDDRSGAV